MSFIFLRFSILESARNDADFLREEAKREREQKIRECNDEIIIKKQTG